MVEKGSLPLKLYVWEDYIIPSLYFYCEGTGGNKTNWSPLQATQSLSQESQFSSALTSFKKENIFLTLAFSPALT